jgi:hypothetical protein
MQFGISIQPINVRADAQRTTYRSVALYNLNSKAALFFDFRVYRVCSLISNQVACAPHQGHV